jgi:hypothetical protein
MISPTPHYYAVAGGAAEIARASGSPGAGPEHFFLAMLHDGRWPLTAISGLINPARAEEAVRGAMDSPGYQPPSSARYPAGGGYVLPSWGGRVAAEMGDSHLGVEHALLAIIRDRESVPARALAAVTDLDAVDAAVVEAATAPVRAHEDAAFLPEDQELDSQLLAAISDAVPEGATFGFNSADGRTWIHVWNSSGSLGREVSRQVLNTALASLDRPPV